MATVVLVGTLDTKGAVYAWMRDRLRAHGCDVVLVDTGILASGRDVPVPDVGAEEVARAAGCELRALRAAGDRGAAIAAMARGAASVVLGLYRAGRLDAILAAGGSCGSAIAAHAMRALPIGVPKLLVSTMASGDVSPYVGDCDLTLTYSVTDIAGLDPISRRILANAVSATAAMAHPTPAAPASPPAATDGVGSPDATSRSASDAPDATSPVGAGPVGPPSAPLPPASGVPPVTGGSAGSVPLSPASGALAAASVSGDGPDSTSGGPLASPAPAATPVPGAPPASGAPPVTGDSAAPVPLASGAPSAPGGSRVVAASMFGVTTSAVEAARGRLEGLGYEVVVFHATGAGGRALERLVGEGVFAGVLDLTTTELADEAVGGVLSAGPGRLTAAGAAGIPQVVAPGALDMVNFGPPGTVPERFAGRRLLAHNPTVTLMRTTAEEMARVGAEIGRRLAGARGAAEVWWPLRGVSAVDAEGAPFHDPEADAAGLAALRTVLRGSHVVLREIDAHLNAPEFALAAADRLHELITAAPVPSEDGPGERRHSGCR
ncbi:Tm-1-like ATP-binding domain-containing protein [Streptantibioticus cattleyicolor]|uniref:Uncharacterized protein n=1 Tax=Streptantibioticus cattleyicolor (strain ATCC 35852 / DSM 46488 / JCM 4925 / NBRC 14057 / NRRL 8057) TaxID=1003195 RepID=F8JIY1_STREN|nr:Tm-1-like ATP-binding domain-containing protein [Streptantibioticus cattleyicolor]AEW98932.1 hypothetical protein SCATT_p07390 [Streptantibioticus cattleyicolor NRRL 8057 = DSM 46488]CCB72021.1 conserved protein of unknown function [Streptantibioticus cattleyicolor NRRL 8057 = DSM 46488]